MTPQTDPPTTLYSYSRLDTFRQCPRQYAYRYLEKPDVEERASVEAHLGTVCHETVQQIYKDLQLSKLMSLEETLAFYDDCWEKSKPKALRIVRERYDETNYKDAGRGYVRAFYESNHPFDDGRTIGIEKRIVMELADGVQLQGYIDRLVDHGNGRYEIIDYKTTKELPTLDDLTQNWQLPLYQMGIQELLPDVRDVTCTWYFMAHNKPITLRKSSQDLADIRAGVLALIREAEAAAQFEPRVSALCSWCDYEPICPARKHLLETELLPPEQFAQDDGVKLVDAYMETQEAIAEEQAELEQLKDKIYRFAKQRGVTVVRGSEHKLKLWTKDDSTQILSKEACPEAADAIERILRKHGLWDRFAMLSKFDLSRALDNRELSDEVLHELSPYLKRETIWRLYPSKLRGWD